MGQTREMSWDEYRNLTHQSYCEQANRAAMTAQNANKACVVSTEAQNLVENINNAILIQCGKTLKDALNPTKKLKAERIIERMVSGALHLEMLKYLEQPEVMRRSHWIPFISHVLNNIHFHR